MSSHATVPAGSPAGAFPSRRSARRFSGGSKKLRLLLGDSIAVPISPISPISPIKKS